MSDLHAVPTAVELVVAVREFLERDVFPATEGRVQFHTRVAVNALGMVERELTLGAAQESAYRAGLADLGAGDEAALGRAIRDGRIDGRADDVRAFLLDTVRARLRVANPPYLEGPSSGDD